MEENEMKRPEKLSYFGVKGLGDKDLIGVIAKPYIKRTPERILKELVEVLDRNSTVTREKFLSVKGVTDDLAEALMASLELGRRRTGRKARVIRTPEDIWNQVRHYAEREQEQMIVIALNGAHEVIYTECVTVGLVNLTLCHPREIFSNAIMNRASAIVISHNHPSGQLKESPEDIAITNRIIKAGSILGINVLDHVIITKDGYLSFKEKGLM